MVFQSKWMDPRQAERNGPYSDCAAGHVAHKPKKGELHMPEKRVRKSFQDYSSISLSWHPSP